MVKKAMRYFGNKCPNCNVGEIFESKNKFFKYPNMNTSCKSCSRKFTSEPGFFVGAMYVSYAFIVLEVILTYFIVQFFFEKALDLRMIPIITSVIIFFLFFNLRMSRLVWFHIFNKT
jgi:hypothetical protein